MLLDVDAVAVGGAGVARSSDGKVVFVAGTLPGERVEATVVDERRTHRVARLQSVLTASPHRRSPPCPHVADGCGGCDFQHIELDEQRRLKRMIAVDVMARIGGVEVEPEVVAPYAPASYRTTVRLAVADGRPGLRRRRSHELTMIDACLVADPLVDELIVDGSFGAATEATVRASRATGERVVVADPTSAGVRMPDDVVVVGADELRAGRRVWLYEDVDDVRFRVSAESFFQPNPEAAAALVDLVRAALDDVSGPLLDACCGIGLFAATVSGERPVIAVERDRGAFADARVNLQRTGARLIRTALERWRPSPVTAAIVDPSRRGLGRRGVGAVAAADPERIVLVSCDPAAGARDVQLFGEAGWQVQAMTVVDLFPETSNIELVTVLDRG